MSVKLFNSCKLRLSVVSMVMIGVAAATLGYTCGAMLAGKQFDRVMVPFGIAIVAGVVLLVDETRRRRLAGSCQSK